MLNERKLTKAELNKREDIIMKMKKNKRELVKRYGKDAEKVMYGRATQLAKKQAEAMDTDRIKELVKDALQNPKKADLNKDGKLSDYEKKRGAAIEKAMANELDATEKAASDKIGRGEEFTDDDASAVADKMPKIKKDTEFKLMGEGPLTENKEEALMELRNILDELQVLGDQAREIISMNFPSYLSQGEAYGAFDMGISSNRYDTTLASIVADIEEYGEEEDEDMMQEDLDLGHEDNEPHMLKADLYRIGKYAMELYQMVDKFEESSEEVDFPHWWQSKVIKAKDALVGAKHYLDFEIKEPQIDAMVDVAQDTEAIDEMEIVNKETGKDITTHVLALLSGKIDKAEFEKLTGLKKDSVDENAYIAMMAANAAKKDKDKKPVKEGTWAIGPIKDISIVLDALDQMMDFKNPKDIVRYLSKLDRFLYNTIGDDVFHDDIDGAKREASEGNMDRAMNRLSDAYSRATYFLERQMDREGLKEEEAGEADMVASDIQKAMNKHKKDDAKMHQLQKARTAMNKGDLEKAKKIAARLAEKLKSK